MPDRTLDELSKTAKDAFYVTVGLGVIALQKAQVQRNELEKRLKAQADELTKLVEGRVRLVEERLRG
jgi:hypothetical protein